MNYTLEIQNLKCGGCVNTVTKELSKIDGITDIKVNDETSVVEFSSDKGDALDLVKSKLASIGYPAVGDDNSIIDKAKSYVSCAIGKMG
jgi:copper chaperone